MMNTGTRANQTGAQLTSFVEGTLRYRGYAKVTQRRFFNLCELRQPIYARECTTGKTIYGGNRRVDFILYHPVKWTECLIIQCKWQSGGGSVDQKYPYDVLSTNINPYQTVFVLGGRGYSTRSGEWLKSQAGKDKVFGVMDQGEFDRFAKAKL